MATMTESSQNVIKLSDLVCTTPIKLKSRRTAGKKIIRKKDAQDSEQEDDVSHHHAETSSFKLSNRAANFLKSSSSASSQQSQHQKKDINVYHEEKMKYFRQLQDSLPEKRKRLEKVGDPTERKRLEKEIRSIENREEETDYLLTTCKILYEYLQVSDEENDKMEIDTDGMITKFVEKYDNVRQQELIHEYYLAVDPHCPFIGSASTCKVDNDELYFCKNKDCHGTIVYSDGFNVCCICGTVSEYAPVEMQMSYKESQERYTKPHFSYKKINHFNEWVSNFQSKENTEIPQYVMEAVLTEMRKEGIKDFRELTTKKIKSWLKKLGFNKYYEHAPHILNRISGIPPLQMTPEVEEKLRQMFKDIQEPFMEIKPKGRKNFLSYSYCLHKMCELLGLDEYLPSFPLLKSREKLRQQDLMWKGICEILGWQYISSI